MDLIVSLEHRFDRTPDGAVWTQTMFANAFWMRYLAVFDRVRVAARVRDVPTAQAGWQRADGEGILFAAIPYYLGPKQYLLRRRQVRHAARSAVGVCDAVIMRIGSQIAVCIEAALRRTGHPYGVEV